MEWCSIYLPACTVFWSNSDGTIASLVWWAKCLIMEWCSIYLPACTVFWSNSDGTIAKVWFGALGVSLWSVRLTHTVVTHPYALFCWSNSDGTIAKVWFWWAWPLIKEYHTSSYSIYLPVCTVIRSNSDGTIAKVSFGELSVSFWRIKLTHPYARSSDQILMVQRHTSDLAYLVTHHGMSN